MGQSHQRLSKKEFVELLGEVWRVAMTPANIKSGFKCTGIFPLDEKVFPEKQFNPVDLKMYRKKKEEEKKKAEEQKEEAKKKAEEHKKKEEEKKKGEKENREEKNENEESKKNEKDKSQDFSLASTSKETTTSINDRSDLSPISSQDQATVLEIQETTTPEVSQSHRTTPGSKSVIEIFAETLKSSNQKQLVQVTPTKKIVKTRLKQNTYGEVLTSEEVMKRLEQAETEKLLKIKIKKEKQEKKKNKVNKVGLNKKKRPAEETKDNKDSPDKPEQKKKLKTVKTNERNSTKRNLKFGESSDSDGDVNEEEMFSAPLSPLVLEGPDEVEYLQPSIENIKPGTHILVNVLGGYRKTVNYKYVCCIQSVLQDEDDDEPDDKLGPKIKVMGLKRDDENATTFCPDEADIFVISETQIVGVLPDPQIIEKDRKFMFVFPGSVAVFEKA